MMVSRFNILVVVAGILSAPAQAKMCPPDTVPIGAVCVDKYEASVWEIPASNTALIRDVQGGKITGAAGLAGATQHGTMSADYGSGCPVTGNNCLDFYAVSIPGVFPSANITWFQAAAACANAGKRLLTNQQWQVAAFGTPDPGTDDGTSDCNVRSVPNPVNTGSRSRCVSDRGASDMVGNVGEWVAEWGDIASGCTNWPAGFGGDRSCFGGDGSVHLPGAFVRGGGFSDGPDAGVFAISTGNDPSLADPNVGFRCGRRAVDCSDPASAGDPACPARGPRPTRGPGFPNDPRGAPALSSYGLFAGLAVLVLIALSRLHSRKEGKGTMKTFRIGSLIVVVGLLLAAAAQAVTCPADSVPVGPVCVDTYEASVWEIPAWNTKLIAKVQHGQITSAAGLAGATQGLGTCPSTGNGCTDVYAVSISGVLPSVSITWFQAAAACANAGKRLLTNQEWQVAAFGTPDLAGASNQTTDCNIAGSGIANTGSRSLCVSNRGAFDTVGNVDEWVADWGDVATGFTRWPPTYGFDLSAVGGDGSVNLPGALFRGGHFFSGSGGDAGVFAADGRSDPSVADRVVGFRCAREP